MSSANTDDSIKALASYSSSLSEADIERHISFLIPELIREIAPTDIWNQKSTQTQGRSDIEVGRCIIEVKRPGRLRTSKEWKKAHSQVSSYAKARKPIQRIVVTDGQTWKSWDSFSNFDTHLNELKLENRKDEEIPISKNELSDFLRDSIESTKPLPADGEVPQSIVQNQIGRLEELYVSFSEKIAHQKMLWERLLKAAESSTGQEGDLFLQHTLLVCIAKIITHQMLRGNPIEDGFAYEAFGPEEERDFFAWPLEFDEGKEWIEDIGRQVGRYEWGTDRDIIRDTYQGLIPKKERHGFGEYYTPDYLAKLIVDEVLDNGWLNKQVPSPKSQVPSPKSQVPSPKSQVPSPKFSFGSSVWIGNFSFSCNPTHSQTSEK